MQYAKSVHVLKVCTSMSMPVNLIVLITAACMAVCVPIPSRVGRVAHAHRANVKSYNVLKASTSILRLATVYQIQTHAAVPHAIHAVASSSVQVENVAPNA